MPLPVDSLDTVFCGAQLGILDNPLIKNKQKTPQQSKNQPTKINQKAVFQSV